MTLPAQCPIVGVGASAGGIEALEGFFRGLPPSPGLAFVVITHLSPSRESHLPEVLARFTALPVLPPATDEAVLHDAGFTDIELFYAAFTFKGWVCRRAGI